MSLILSQVSAPIPQNKLFARCRHQGVLQYCLRFCEVKSWTGDLSIDDHLGIKAYPDLIPNRTPARLDAEGLRVFLPSAAKEGCEYPFRVIFDAVIRDHRFGAALAGDADKRRVFGDNFDVAVIGTPDIASVPVLIELTITIA